MDKIFLNIFKKYHIYFHFYTFISDNFYSIMIFRTEINLPPSPFNILHRHQIAMLGSCFSKNIGDRLITYRFNCTINPFGTIFHPLAIAKIMDYVHDNQKIEAHSLIMSQGIYVHPDFHSIVGSPDVKLTIAHINNVILEMHQSLSNFDYVFITLGTSVGYISGQTGKIVANCHKLPATLFTKTNSEIDVMAEALIQSCKQWHDINPSIRFVFTVSPVRHTRDGIIENARSKAKLVLAVEKICEQLAYTSYFPAYEWMIDDLRDYRYYDKDLIHPNEQAIDYIWEQFSDHYFDEETIKLNQRIIKIVKSLQHRPFNPDTDIHRQFTDKVMQDIEDLTKAYPWIKF